MITLYEFISYAHTLTADNTKLTADNTKLVSDVTRERVGNEIKAARINELEATVECLADHLREWLTKPPIKDPVLIEAMIRGIVENRSVGNGRRSR